MSKRLLVSVCLSQRGWPDLQLSKLDKKKEKENNVGCKKELKEESRSSWKVRWIPEREAVGNLPWLGFLSGLEQQTFFCFVFLLRGVSGMPAQSRFAGPERKETAANSRLCPQRHLDTHLSETSVWFVCTCTGKTQRGGDRKGSKQTVQCSSVGGKGKGSLDLTGAIWLIQNNSCKVGLEGWRGGEGGGEVREAGGLSVEQDFGKKGSGIWKLIPHVSHSGGGGGEGIKMVQIVKWKDWTQEKEKWRVRRCKSCRNVTGRKQDKGERDMQKRCS